MRTNVPLCKSLANFTVISSQNRILGLFLLYVCFKFLINVFVLSGLMCRAFLCCLCLMFGHPSFIPELFLIFKI